MRNILQIGLILAALAACKTNEIRGTYMDSDITPSVSFDIRRPPKYLSSRMIKSDLKVLEEIFQSADVGFFDIENNNLFDLGKALEDIEKEALSNAYTNALDRDAAFIADDLGSSAKSNLNPTVFANVIAKHLKGWPSDHAGIASGSDGYLFLAHKDFYYSGVVVEQKNNGNYSAQF